MAHFQLTDGTGIGEICLDSTVGYGGRLPKITLDQWGGDYDGNPLEVGTLNKDLIRVTVASSNTAKKITRFEVQALPGAKGKAEVYARFAQDQKNGQAKGAEFSRRLEVTVGAVINHRGMVYDLFADLLGRSDDARKLWVYTRALAARNNTIPAFSEWERLLADQPLKQNTDAKDQSKWDCGAALARFGQTNFGRNNISVYNNTLYYERPSSDKKADLKMNKARLQQGVFTIRNLLSRNIAVRVFVVHHDGFRVEKSGLIGPSNRTHYLTIIGCDLHGRFLFLDPWPGAARLMYTSGIFTDVDAAFMGVLMYDGNAITTDVDASRGGHDYTVLSGP